jgi:hypothetical protein
MILLAAASTVSNSFVIAGVFPQNSPHDDRSAPRTLLSTKVIPVATEAENHRQ